MVVVKIRIRRPSRFGIQAICIMSIWGVPDLSTRPRALRALGTRDKSDTPQIDMIQIELVLLAQLVEYRPKMYQSIISKHGQLNTNPHKTLNLI